MPRSHVEIAGEVGTRGLWPAALSSTSLAVAAASTSASSVASAGAHCSERARASRGSPPSMATFTTPWRSRNRDAHGAVHTVFVSR